MNTYRRRVAALEATAAAQPVEPDSITAWEAASYVAATEGIPVAEAMADLERHQRECALLPPGASVPEAAQMIAAEECEDPEVVYAELINIARTVYDFHHGIGRRVATAN